MEVAPQVERTASSFFATTSGSQKRRTRRSPDHSADSSHLCAGTNGKCTKEEKDAKQPGNVKRKRRSQSRLSGRTTKRANRGLLLVTVPCGEFTHLPNEVLERILLMCDVQSLGCLAMSCSYFQESNILERVSITLLRDTMYGCLLMPQVGETWLYLLQFVMKSIDAEAQAKYLSLGAYHSAGVFAPECPASAAEPALLTFGRGFHGQLGRQGYDNSNTPVKVELPTASYLITLGCEPGAASAAERAKEGEGDSVDAAADATMADAAAAPVRGSAGASTSGMAATRAGGAAGAGAALVKEGPVGVVAVVCGGSHCAALTRRGTLLTWGLASSGELGHGGWTPIEVDLPRPVLSFGAVRIKAVSAGANHTLAVGACGGLWSCGRGRHGQLGQGHFHDVGPLQCVEALRGVRVRAAAAGGGHSLVLTEEGASVWAWGDNRHGQCGLGNRGPAHEVGFPWPQRVEIPSALAVTAQSVITAISAGGHHSLVVSAAGSLYAAGRGRHGALGLGNSYSRRMLVPVDVGAGFHSGGTACTRCPGGCRVVQAAAGGFHSTILTACGSVRTTGHNVYGQLGHGDMQQRFSFTPVRALERTPVLAIAVGEDHTAAVTTKHRVFFWGRGDWGQLGVHDSRSHWKPVPLPGMQLQRAVRANNNPEGRTTV